MDHIDNTKLGDTFQEIVTDFSEMAPTSLDHLEQQVLDAIYKIGSCLMDWKLSDWNTELRQDICQKCGHNVENRKRCRQVATWVSDIYYHSNGTN